MLNLKWIKFCRIYWPTFVLVLTPVLLLPILLLPDDLPSNRCLYVLLLMAVYWSTEAIPMAFTSLLPIVLFPLLGVMDTRTTCAYYMTEATMMFVGGLLIALAVEQSGLHQRVALVIIARVGCSPRKLTLGLFGCTAFISLWLSNTAAVAIMVPILMGVLQELQEQGLVAMYEEAPPRFEGRVRVPFPERRRPSATTLCYFLGTAFNASIGGVGTLIGAGPNMILKGVFEKRFPHAPQLAFNGWLAFNAPLVLLGVLLTWLWLQWLYMGLFRPHSEAARAHRRAMQAEQAARRVIQRKLRELGRLDAHQLSVGLLFCAAVVAYLWRDPGFAPGWGSLFATGTARDTTAALLVVVLLFMLPRRYDCVAFWTLPAHRLPTRPSEALLTWPFVHQRMEWGILILLGGGFALSAGGQQSGLNRRIGNYFRSFETLGRFPMVAAVTLLVQLATELTSNMTLASVVLPVFAEMAVNARLHPLALLVPACVSCDLSFLLPVSTPPNAIVATIAKIPTREMIKAGLGPTLICVLLLWLLFPTWGLVVFPGIDEFPAWAAANETNRAA